MAFSVLRLFRPQRLLFQPSRRAIASKNVIRRRYKAEGAHTDKSQSSIKDASANITNSEISTSAVNQQPSEVHWALWSGYKIGRRIPMQDHLQLTPTDWAKAIPPWKPYHIPLRIRYRDGLRHLKLPNIWLRDNCQCSECVNHDTMQRSLNTFSIPPSVLPFEVITEKEGLKVTWSNDGHVSIYPWDMILGHRSPEQLGLDEPEPGARPSAKASNNFKFWGSEIAADPPAVHYDEIMADEKGVGKWTQKIREYGFCYVDGCPVSPEKTQELLERISFVRTTHYGGFYDFTADLAMKDTAYTTQALPAHTDTTYFTDPAGLQMFHLLSHTHGEGGASLLVDGFKAAQVLSATDKAAYDSLARRPVPWHASGNEGITIAPSRKEPVFSFGNSADQHGSKLMQIRWNNDDRGAFDAMQSKPHSYEDFVSITQWYRAAGTWYDILQMDSMQYWAQLKPGRPLIFDNWRVLHGRSAFTGKRRICGGYLNRDDYMSRWRNTNLSKEEARAHALL